MKNNNYTKKSMATFRNWLAAFVLVAFCSFNSMGQVSVTATAGTVGPTPYTTLKDAFDAINLGTHQGAIAITINTPGTTEIAQAILNSSGAGSAVYSQVTINPIADGVVINGTGTAASGRGVIELNGADNVTIDGDNPNTGGTNRNLTINNPMLNTTTYTSVIRIAAGTVAPYLDNNNITIRNCILNGSATAQNSSLITSTTGAGNTTFGIIAGPGGGAAVAALASVTTAMNASASVNTLLIDNNQINQCARGIGFLGQTSVSFNSTGVTVTNNVIGDATSPSGIPPYTTPTTTVYTKGIFLQGIAASTVTGNNIRNIFSYIGTTITAIDLVAAHGTSITISNNTITALANNGTSAVTGIGMVTGALGTGTFTIAGNTISNFQTPAGSTANIVGITTSYSGTSGMIERNKISGLFSHGTGTGGAAGIILLSGNNVTVRNNMIWDLMNDQTAGTTAPFGGTFGINGMRVTAGTGHKFYHNSVYLFGSLAGTVSTDHSYCWGATSIASTGMDVRNNIFANFISGGNPTGTRNTVIYLPSTTLTSTFNLTLNNNAYYGGAVSGSPSLNTLAQAGTTIGTGQYLISDFNPGSTSPAANLRAYTSTLSAAGTNDNLSFANTSTPPFISTSNLHLDLASGQLANVEQKGATGTGVTTDIDGIDIRPDAGTTFPDMGADEVAVPPSPGNLQLSSTTYSGNEGTTLVVTVNRVAGSLGTVGATITLADITATGGASCGGSVDYVNASPILVSLGNTVTSTTVNIPLCSDAGVDLCLETFSITLSAPTGGAGLGTPTTATASIQDVPLPLNGTYTVGTGGNYTSLTNDCGIFSAINAAGITGNITINIISNLTGELGTNALNAFASPFTVKINPIGAPRTITGSFNGALIRMNGSSRVTIDGSIGGTGTTRDLTITNTSVTTPSVVLLGSIGTTPITNNTVKNCIIINGANTSSAVVISDAGVLGNPGFFSNITIQNNDIQKAYIGVFANGGTSPQNGSNLIYTQNTVNTAGTNAIRLVALYMQGVNGATVSQNTVGNFNSADAENDVGIWLASGTINATVSNNSVSPLAYTGTSAQTPTGIQITSGVASSNNNVIGNSVSTITTTGGTAVRGIFVSSTDGNMTVQKNNVQGIINSNTGTFGAYGIDITAGNNITVKNNFVSNVTGDMTGGAAFSTTFGIFGIRVGSGNNILVYHNSVNLYGARTGTATTSLLTAAFGLVGTGSLNCDVRNNIFANNITGGTTSIANVSAYLPSGGTSLMNLTWNNNAYFFGTDAARQGVGQAGTTAGTNFYTTLAALAAYSSTLGVATNDNASTASTAAVPYVSANDLHRTSDDNLGTGIPAVTDDIDGQPRNATTPDRGADEFPQCLANGGTASGSTAFCSSGTPTITASGYSADGSTYQWYSSTVFADYPNAGNIIGGQTNPAALTTGSVSTTTYFWLRVTCPGNTSVANSAPVVTITINTPPLADAPGPVTACDTYTLPALTNGNYFTGSGGTGTALFAGNSITSTQTIFVYNPGTPPCTPAQNSFVVTINYTPLADAPGPVTACDSYTLPALTNGNYFTGSGGTGTALFAGNSITSTQTIFVYNPGLPPCTPAQNSFLVTINYTPLADAPGPVTACDSYTLPALTNGNYFTGSGGTGTPLFAGNVITSTQTIFVYNPGLPPCTPAQNSFLVTINTSSVAPTGVSGNITICLGGNTTLTVTGGTLGTGAIAEWFTVACGVGGTSAGTGPSITVNPSVNTTYFVRYNGTCNTTTCFTFTVTVNTNCCLWTNSTVYPISVTGEAVVTVGSNLYSFGGVSSSAPVANSYSFDGSTWTPILNLPAALQYPSAVTDGTNIFIMGGVPSSSIPQTTVYRYNVATNTYTTLAPFTVGTWNHAAVFLNGKIYKFAGTGPATASSNVLEIYDITSNTWTLGAPYPLALSFVSAVAIGNFIYAGGGIDAVTTVESAKTYRYDPVLNTWNDAAIADLPASRWAAASSYYRGGFIMATGAVGLAFTNTAVSWDLATNTWTGISNTLAARYRLNGAVLCGSFYAIGGISSVSGFTGTNDNQKYNCIPGLVSDLSITKTDGAATYLPGGSTTYTIVASNLGPDAVTGAMVTDNFPAAITAVSWTAVYAGGASGTTSGTGNINVLVNMPSGGTATFTAICTISGAASGNLVNTATATVPCGVTDPTSTNNSATDTDSDCQPAAFSFCPGNISANTALNLCNAVVTYTPVITGSPAPTVTYTFTNATTGSGSGTGSGSAFNVGTTNVTINAVNACGNVNCSFTVTVVDNQPPVFNFCPSNTTVACGASTLPAATGTATATDNCSATVTSSDVNTVSGSCGGTITRTWTATDPSLNSTSSCVQIITVSPGALPIISNPGNTTVACGGVPSPSTRPFTNSLSPGCLISGTSNVSTQTAQSPAGACGGTITETWTATDVCGRPLASVSRIITVSPAALPTMTALAATTVACGAIPSPSTLPFSNGLSGGCLISGTSNLSTFSATPGPCGGTVTETWTATDACSRPLASVSRVITVSPAALPVISNPGNTTVACGSVPAPSTRSFTNSLSGGCLISGISNTSTQTAQSPAGACGGTITETWTATDACGRALASVSRIITVSPAALPTMPAQGNITVACGGVPATSTLSFSNGLSGGCLISGTSNLSTKTSQSPAGACGGTITETWTATDACGRPLASVSRIITVSPAALPTMPAQPNITVPFSSLPAPSTLPYSNGLSGGCLISGNSNISTYSPTPTACVGSVTQTWTATDPCGRPLVSVSRTVTVLDDVAPTAICKNVTVFLSAGGTASVTAAQVNNGSFDNCGTLNLVSVSPSSFNCANTGSNTVTLTVNDGHGNTSTCTSTVTVVDNILPTITCPPTVIVNTNPGVCYATNINFGTPIFNDNCAGATVANNALVLYPSGQFPQGGFVLQWEVTDLSANKASCNQIVGIVDAEPPVAICKNLCVYLNSAGVATITGADINNGSHDNCGIDPGPNGLVASPNSFTYANAGANTVTLTVKDVNGNTSTCTSTVTVGEYYSLFGADNNCSTPTGQPDNCHVNMGNGNTINGNVGSYRLITTGGGVVINGNVYSGGRVNFANGVSSKSIAAANLLGQSGNIISTGNSADITGDVNVAGNSYINQNGGSFVTGVVRHPAGTTYSGPAPGGGVLIAAPILPALPGMPTINAYSCGGANITTSATLIPASYGNITLGNPAGVVITFAGPGNYYFSSIKMGQGGIHTFKFDFLGSTTGKINIYVCGDIDFGTFEALWANPNTPDACRVYFETHGTGSTNGTNSVMSAIIALGSHFYGRVWAPYGGIKVGSGSCCTYATGSLWSAKQVQLEGAVTFNGCSSPCPPGPKIGDEPTTTEVSMSDMLQVYPNPTSGKTTVRFFSEFSTSYTLKVMDNLGRVVLRNESKAIAGDNTQEVDMSHLAKGLYLIELENHDYSQKVKVVVQ